MGLFVWMQKKHKGSHPQHPEGDFAVGVMESGSGYGMKPSVEMQQKRVSMANPLQTSQSGLENSAEQLTQEMRTAGWASNVDDEGDLYYYNHVQGVSTYDIPVYRDGKWVPQSDDEDSDESDGDEAEASRIGHKKPSILSKAKSTQNAITSHERAKGNKSKSLFVVKSKQLSVSASKSSGKQNKISKRSQSLAVGATSNDTSKPRWQMKKVMMSKPAIPIVKEVPEEEEEEEGDEEPLVLTPPWKKPDGRLQRMMRVMSTFTTTAEESQRMSCLSSRMGHSSQYLTTRMTKR